jgi:hypothetical protein
LHPPLCCLTFKQCERGCEITRTKFIWWNCSVTHPPFIWGNSILKFPSILNILILNLLMLMKTPTYNFQFPP